MKLFKKILILFFIVISAGTLLTGCLPQNEERQESQNQDQDDSRQDNDNDKDKDRDND